MGPHPSLPASGLRSCHGLEVESEIFGCALRIGEQHHPVVQGDHAPVVGRHDLLEGVLVELLANGLGQLIEVELDLVRGVDPNHRGKLPDAHIRLLTHHVGHGVADLVVHQRYAALIRGFAMERETVVFRHRSSSFGVVRFSSPRMLRTRSLARLNACSNVTALFPCSDQSGSSACAAVRVTGTHRASQSPKTRWLWSACCSSLASGPIRSFVYARSRSKSFSATPITVGVTKSPWVAARLMTKPLRNSSPSSGSKARLAATTASHQSRIAVSCSTLSRVGCHIGSLPHTCLCAEPSTSSRASLTSRL